MDYDELEKLNKEFAKETIEIMKDFNEVYKKWFNKSPRTTILIMMQLPINVLSQSIENMSDNLHSKCFPELPNMMYRFMNPFKLLKEKWGKISDKEFMKEYAEIYQSQFEDWFPSEQEKEQFKKWYKKK